MTACRDAPVMYEMTIVMGLRGLVGDGMAALQMVGSSP